VRAPRCRTKPGDRSFHVYIYFWTGKIAVGKEGQIKQKRSIAKRGGARNDFRIPPCDDFHAVDIIFGNLLCAVYPAVGSDGDISSFCLQSFHVVSVERLLMERPATRFVGIEFMGSLFWNTQGKSARARRRIWLDSYYCYLDRKSPRS
jgi:hypothetical protein